MENEIEKEIQDVNDFTKSYWEEMLKAWENDSEWIMTAPHYGEITSNIIRNRNEYVMKLKKDLERYRMFNKK